MGSGRAGVITVQQRCTPQTPQTSLVIFSDDVLHGLRIKCSENTIG